MTTKDAGTGRVVRMALLLEESPGIGRDAARRLAEKVQPGDVLDFEGFWLESNSFADEFIKALFDLYGPGGLKRIRMENIPQLLGILFRKSFCKYAQEESGRHASKGSF